MALEIKENPQALQFAVDQSSVLLPFTMTLAEGRVLPSDAMAWEVNRLLIKKRSEQRVFSKNLPSYRPSGPATVAKVAYEAGKLFPDNDQAIYMAMHVIESNTVETPDAFSRLGQALMKNRDCSGAEALLSGATGRYVKNPTGPLFYNYGIALECQGRLRKAKEAFRDGGAQGYGPATLSYERLKLVVNE